VEAARRRKRARNERETAPGSVSPYHCVTRLDRLPLSDCFSRVLDLALSEAKARPLEGDGRPGLRLRSLQHKEPRPFITLLLLRRVATHVPPSEEALSGSMQGVATRHYSQMNSTCGPATSLPATTCYGTRCWWGSIIPKQPIAGPKELLRNLIHQS
jgi:hypothetical protein